MEREKAKKVAEAKAKSDAEAAANKKSKSQRVEERRQENMRKKLDDEEDDSDDDEEDADKRARLRRTEQEADLKHAQDLFADIGVNNRSGPKAVVSLDPNDPSKNVDLSALPLFNPNTKDQFLTLRETMAPIINKNHTKAQYTIFLQEFVKLISKDLPSEQIKKIASGLTTLSNEKMKEEKASEKGGKKSKAAKSKTALNANRDVSHRADVTAYDDGGLDE